MEQSTGGIQHAAEYDSWALAQAREGVKDS